LSPTPVTELDPLFMASALVLANVCAVTGACVETVTFTLAPAEEELRTKLHSGLPIPLVLTVCWETLPPKAADTSAAVVSSHCFAAAGVDGASTPPLGALPVAPDLDGEGAALPPGLAEALDEAAGGLAVAVAAFVGFTELTEALLFELWLQAASVSSRPAAPTAAAVRRAGRRPAFIRWFTVTMVPPQN